MFKESMAKLRYLLLLLALTLTACTNPLAPQDSGPETLQLTGFLEAGATDIAAEVGGRLVEISVEEGDSVEAGQQLVRLDDSLLQLQLDLADADIAEAEAKLARLQSAVRPVDVKLAEARVAAAESALAAAESALADAILLRDNPQALDVQIAQANAALLEAKAHARAARHLAEAADIEVQMWEAITRDLWAGVDVQLPGGGEIHIDTPRDKIDYANRQWNLAGQNAWSAWQDAQAAEAAVEQARTTLADLKRTKANPQTAEAQIIAATNARDEAKAGVAQARAALAAVSAGPTATQIAAAESAVEQARAARDALAVQLEQTRLQAPTSGLISARYRSPGEVIGPHQPVLTLQDAGHLQLT
ncbi:MAG TPA: biotin/lipoyl-binding protein, partial [Caldilineae bacterium]|nr:biotin/lipoyl-binding protein [Caldilineae bacterium]